MIHTHTYIYIVHCAKTSRLLTPTTISKSILIMSLQVFGTAVLVSEPIFTSWHETDLAVPMNGFLLSCKRSHWQTLSPCTGANEVSPGSFETPPSSSPAANLLIYCQSFCKRSISAHKLQPQTNAWSTTLRHPRTSFKHFWGKSILGSGGLFLFMLVKNSVTSGFSNRPRLPIIHFKMVNEQKSQFVFYKQPMSHFVEQQQIRMHVSSRGLFIKCLHLFL